MLTVDAVVTMAAPAFVVWFSRELLLGECWVAIVNFQPRELTNSLAGVEALGLCCVVVNTNTHTLQFHSLHHVNLQRKLPLQTPNSQWRRISETPRNVVCE
ncbi:hypothetical protein ACLKA6_002012 [Drosophila palustris]